MSEWAEQGDAEEHSCQGGGRSGHIPSSRQIPSPPDVCLQVSDHVTKLCHVVQCLFSGRQRKQCLWVPACGGDDEHRSP